MLLIIFRKTLLRVIIGLLISLPIMACDCKQEKLELKVGYLPILDHLTLLVSHAQDNAQFKYINVHPKLFKKWNEMAGALKAGVINAAFILSPLAMDLFDKGANINVVLLAHRDGSAITVRKDLTIHSAIDLRGRAIAIPDQKATHTALLNQYLLQSGLSLKDIEPKVIAPPNMITAMQLHKIDAFIVAEPFGAKAQAEGVGKILVLTKDIVPHHVECIVVVNHEVLQQHPQAIQEWILSLIKAGEFIERDKAENNAQQTAQLTAKFYLPHSAKTIAMGLLNPSNRISFVDLRPKLEDLNTIMDISIQAGIINRIDLTQFISDPLSE